jgi:hypothetical protein
MGQDFFFKEIGAKTFMKDAKQFYGRFERFKQDVA